MFHEKQLFIVALRSRFRYNIFAALSKIRYIFFFFRQKKRKAKKRAISVYAYYKTVQIIFFNKGSTIFVSQDKDKIHINNKNREYIKKMSELNK